MDEVTQVVSFLTKAIPFVVALFEAHARDEKAALDALEAAFLEQRRLNDARLAAKHRSVP
jgi:hypothetical protein